MTGVQTCALPIYHRGAAGGGVSERGRRLGSQGHAAQRCPATEGSAAGPRAGDGGGIAGSGFGQELFLFWPGTVVKIQNSLLPTKTLFCSP